MIDELRSSLLEFGLGSKEADVYLAMLQLGSSSVQEIAEQAGVNRSTTYILIEELKQRGLASTFEKGKKVYFSAENPQRLVGLVVDEFSKLEGKRQQLDVSLPKLLALFNGRNDKPKVRFFEGEEALAAVRQEIVDAREPVWEVYAVDEDLIRVANIRGAERIETSRAVPGSRALMAIKPGCEPPYFELHNFEARVIPYGQYPFSGDIEIVGDRLYVMTIKQSQGMGIIVENRELTQIFRALYEAAWSCAIAWTPPPQWHQSSKNKNPPG